MEPTQELTRLIQRVDSDTERYMVTAAINLIRGLLETGATVEGLYYLVDVVQRDMESEKAA